jgi:ferredoxin-type protein NapH
LRSRIKRNLLRFNTPRRVVQLLSFIFFSSIVFNVGVLPLLVPVLWTWGLQQNTVGDAFTALQFMFYNAVFPWLAIASFLIVGILIGKSLCGWVCPFGFIQDLVGFIKRKKTEFSPRTHGSMIYIKYGVLVITLFISITFSAAKVAGISSAYENSLGIFVKAPFTTLSPAETLCATVPETVHNAPLGKPVSDLWSFISGLSPLFWMQLFIMVCVIVLAVYVPRSWCKYLCPHGAIMAILNRFSFLGLRRDLHKCPKGACRLCVEVCPMRVRILDLPWEKFNDPECIYCLKCVDACPHGGIKLKYP